MSGFSLHSLTAGLPTVPSWVLTPHRRLPGLLVLPVGILLSALLTLHLRHSEENALRLDLERRTANLLLHLHSGAGVEDERPPDAAWIDATIVPTSRLAPSAETNELLVRRNVWLEGAPHLLETRPRADLVAFHRTSRPWWALALGSLTSGVLALYLLGFRRRAERTRQLATRRTGELVRAKESLELEIAEHKRHLADLQESEERFRTLFRSSPQPSFLSDLNGLFLEVNRAAEDLCGRYERELVGRTPLELCLVPDAGRFRALRIHCQGRRGRASGPHELVLRRPDAPRVIVEITIRPLNLNGRVVLLGLARDLTEEKRLERDRARVEEHARNAQKMEAVGTLAAGVAHDFNNLLTSILGFSELLKLRVDADNDLYPFVDGIECAAKRAADLTGQLVAFARRGKYQNVAVDLHRKIRKVTSLLERTIDKRIEIVCELEDDLPWVQGDPDQLEQVLLNLAVNARDAMPEGGILRFRTASSEGPRAFPPAGDATSETWVELVVEDTGSGIPRSIRPHIFEPFFTTKRSGKGTGMGLATVYGIVENHGGHIEVESEEGAGARFLLFLPPAEHTRASSKSPAPLSRSEETGEGCILVVDDEEGVRLVASEMLRSLGYEVLTADDGREAVECYRSRFRSIDLVILDMIMPRMGGRDCYFALKEINPGLRAILASGFSEEGAAREILDAGLLGVVTKPYRREELGSAVSVALER